MIIPLPELSLIVLIGASSAGKSSFARRSFKLTEIITSDFCRALVADDENDLEATGDAFEILHFIAGKRLKGGRPAVIDATNLKLEDRKPLVMLAREYHCVPVAIVFDLPESLLQERNRGRSDRTLVAAVIRRQRDQLHRGMRSLEREGFRQVHVLRSQEEVDAATIEWRPTWTNRREDRGPFDIIGDIHGCFDELAALLRELGYDVTHADDRFVVQPPEGRRAIFLGDLVDRGPNTPDVLRLVMDMVEAGVALCVPGNHEQKLLRALRGRNVQVTHGLAESLAQISAQPPEFRQRVMTFIDALVSHYLLDGGRLIVAHAGMKPEMAGRASGRVREFALYGETTGETDEYGLPVRHNWAQDYRGKAIVVYGHTPVPEPRWVNDTICIDTGCVFGGRLTALRYPERELISVPAAHTYYEPARPFLPEGEAAPGPLENGAAREYHDLLDISDVLGKRIIGTQLAGNVTIREENAAAAIKVMSRFAVDPRWLIYLPPTMSPTETSKRPDLLEHPAEAFGYFLQNGVPRVVCEEKHMGSRAVVIVCRDEHTAARRFGISDGDGGICYTRTGRRFFNDRATETALLQRVRTALDAVGMWERFNSDWFCLDCELLPWSAKAGDLLRQQYAPVGAAGTAALGDAVAALGAATASGIDLDGLLDRYATRAGEVGRYIDAYRRYCWPVGSIDDLKLAPFHLLASEGAVHTDRDHVWHIDTLAELCQTDQSLLATPYRVVDLTDTESQAAAIGWWEELTAAGGEGMVVKPYDFVARSRRGLVQPGVKCRGPEYLRIIYGPEYTAPENLERLRNRSVALKRSLALREFALGIEALQRFVRHEPLYRVHECVFGVLAMESEPVDPRL